MIVFNDCGFKLLVGKIIICLCLMIILGWIWIQGCFFVSFYKVLVLFICKFLDIVYGLCLFIGVYKMLFCVLLSCVYVIVFFEGVISGFQLKDKIKWLEELIENFNIV